MDYGLLSDSTVELMTDDGELLTLSHQDFKNHQQFVCCVFPKRYNIHTPYVIDVMELVAFVLPGVFVVPTEQALADLCAIEYTESPLIIIKIMHSLMAQLDKDNTKDRQYVHFLHQCQSPLAALFYALWGEDFPALDSAIPIDFLLNILKKHPAWEDQAPYNYNAHNYLKKGDALKRLDIIRPANAEKRPIQELYTEFVGEVFSNDNHLYMAEAATGTGKTLGYLASASVFAEKNDKPVIVSTYTRYLQHQVAKEGRIIYPDDEIYKKNVVIRKGRENYICLLNVADEITNNALDTQQLRALCLIIRWLEHYPEGDVQSDDFPSWFSDILPPYIMYKLRDKKGECLHGSCNYYKQCVIEKKARDANNARIIVTNHTFLFNQNMMNYIKDEPILGHYILDEGHHIFDTIDNVSACYISLQELADLRLWLTGNDGQNRSRRIRGLRKRLDYIELPEKHHNLVQELMLLCRHLPLFEHESAGRQYSQCSIFYAIDKANQDKPHYYNHEYAIDYAYNFIDDATYKLATTIADMRSYVGMLLQAIQDILNNDMQLDKAMRDKMESLVQSITLRALTPLDGYHYFLQSLIHKEKKDDVFCDWVEISHGMAAGYNVTFKRHLIDPSTQLAPILWQQASQAVVTSASLRGDLQETTWHLAQKRLGLHTLNHDVYNIKHQYFASHFNYKDNIRIYIIQDIDHTNITQLANAMVALFMHAGGGGVGLFTAISRLKKAYNLMKPSLQKYAISLYAQHTQDMSLPTLMSMFRYQDNACILGTDALRDGIDVPGNSLRMVVFEKVPWPKPDILYKARCKLFGKQALTSLMVKQRLKQAIGRIIRKHDDKGVFVMLDKSMPSRFYDAFPEQATIHKMGIKEALLDIKNYLASNAE